MNRNTEIVLFYIAASKGGGAKVSKKLIEEIDTVFKLNEDMCLKRRSVKGKEVCQLAIVPAKLPDEVYQNVIEYFNQRVGCNMKWTAKATQQLINARVAEGFTVSDFKKVIDNKINSWGYEKKMRQYLRPSTLFGTKFEEYLNETTASDIGGQASYDINQIKADAATNTEIKGL